MNKKMVILFISAFIIVAIGVSYFFYGCVFGGLLFKNGINCQRDCSNLLKSR